MNAGTPDAPQYLAYLLRLWRVTTQNGARWRASLENVQTRQVQGFGTLQALFDFLTYETQIFPADLTQEAEDPYP
jgi:hypothetical protein